LIADVVIFQARQRIGVFLVNAEAQLRIGFLQPSKANSEDQSNRDEDWQ
jgi:hypothetical protein